MSNNYVKMSGLLVPYQNKGGGSYNLLSTSTVTSAVSEVDFTSNIDSTYKRYEFHIIDLQPATNAAHLYLRLIPDGLSAQTGSQYGYSGIFHGSDDGSATFGTRRHSNGQGYVELTNEVGSGAEENLQGKVTIFNPARPRSTLTISRVVIPAISGVPVPGA